MLSEKGDAESPKSESDFVPPSLKGKGDRGKGPVSEHVFRIRP